MVSPKGGRPAGTAAWRTPGQAPNPRTPNAGPQGAPRGGRLRPAPPPGPLEPPARFSSGDAAAGPVAAPRPAGTRGKVSRGPARLGGEGREVGSYVGLERLERAAPATPEWPFNVLLAHRM